MTAATLAAMFLLLAGPVSAAPITFQDHAADPGSGITYERVPTPDYLMALEELRQDSLVTPLTLADFVGSPYSPHGQPGVVIFDHDDDGDLDVYVTNGPGADNSLYSNQLVETGTVGFVDVGVATGTGVWWQDGRGACAGDVDNDGDKDLLVLGGDSPNVLLENLGGGQFAEVVAAGIEGGDRSHVSCAMGDIDNDGLLDVLVANSYDHHSLVACVVETLAENQHNQLYLNLGGLAFQDISATSGIEDLTGFGPGNDGSAGITWAVGMVDLDTDGDLDLVFGDDQCAFPKAAYGGFDRGFIHILINDGTGSFVDHPLVDSPVASGSWMGLGFGDFNCDGNIDIFGSNFGDYHLTTEGLPFTFGDEASRWLLGDGTGGFSDPGVGTSGASVFGWGNAVFDYDNDGDHDVAYFGALHANFYATADNPGTMLLNQACTAEFVPDLDALRLDYTDNNVTGVAGGDLDGDGFVDLVTASRYVLPPGTPLAFGVNSWGVVWDPTAYFVPSFGPGPDPGEFVWAGVEFDNGTLGIELNSGNGNNHVGVTVVGSVDLTPGGSVNRDGVGAVITFTPHNSAKSTVVPVHAGSSFGSQHALEALFGLGNKQKGVVDVMWPGGVRNRLYNVHDGERVTFPEIPCSYDASWANFQAYKGCVDDALDDLQDAGVISAQMKGRLYSSAVKAYHQP
ncbi:FG-GAP repeat domain-containing protein [Paraliomyxa miuraensis]|uniref:FG-GAP repeat domain-containing protein n=1 Tax=Paraliomyxa miuraensis TaxID=376150 RepID=UPI0022549730|nr:VCBS repeat-containing protein [Paraliomyxa miuraensis]